MATEVRADPVELSRLATIVLTASQDLADAWRTAKDGLNLPSAAFGNSDGAAAVHFVHELTVTDAEAAIDRQSAILEEDSDRLYRVAFAYERAELEAQEGFSRARPVGAP
jgi:hypothetical protein